MEKGTIKKDDETVQNNYAMTTVCCLRSIQNNFQQVIEFIKHWSVLSIIQLLSDIIR